MYLLSLDLDKGQMYQIESPTLLKLNRITVKCNIDGLMKTWISNLVRVKIKRLESEII